MSTILIISTIQNILQNSISVTIERVINTPPEKAPDIANLGPFSRYLSTDSTASMASFDQPLSDDNQSTSYAGEFAKDEFKLTEDEKMEIGGVNPRIYWEYVKHVGLHVFLFAVLGYISFVSFETSANIWLSEWSSEGLYNETIGTTSTTWGLTIYGSLGFADAACVVIGSSILVYGSVKASRNFHKKDLESVMRSPMSFFDRTPMGRIMNRFSTDMDIMDIQIYPVLDAWFHCLLYSLASFTVIGMNTPMFLVILLPIGVAYYILQRLNLHTFRQVMRLESTTRSPIYSHFLNPFKEFLLFAHIKSEKSLLKVLRKTKQTYVMQLQHFYL
ncbi:canalicular multispecific organic anion transporter 2 [Caerostris extrusa]|uniref:Canalicular multispecific organic anion transporter 2 n=1 Tax=Caerostris extrusa TaxID=172846 RepID=A0AAV4NAJ5_CAEEX|nr:canalicular multispecific organic anion transporter 2 [Caerostris extrusa]